jgi:hypothetical protein
MTKPINVSTDIKINIKGNEFTLSKYEANQLLTSLKHELNVLDYNARSVPEYPTDPWPDCATLAYRNDPAWTKQINTDNPVSLNGVHTSTYTFNA